MSFRGIITAFATLALPFAAWPSAIQDPQMGVDAGSFSNPLTGNTTIVPNGNGGGAFGFYNPTGAFITALTFDTDLQPGLSDKVSLDPDHALIGGALFACNDASTPGFANPFFINCAINYDSPTGVLSIRFYGVNPGGQPGTGDDAGAHVGIPPLLPGCSSTPDASGCGDVGHFILTLNNGFTPDPNGSGGWSPSATPGVFLPGGPQFSVVEIDAVPEPATTALFAAGLAILAVTARLRRGGRFW